ncbi:MAG: sodium:calcium antiporter [Woeseiaceae bacterium]
MAFFGLFAVLLGLWLGTKATIHGAVAVAERLRVPEFIIGLTVLSVGSDLPELAIAVDAAIWNLHSGEASDVVVGSALGSSLGQIGFVLGITALIGHLALPREVVYQHGSALLGSIVLLGLVGFDGQVTRLEGAMLAAAYAAYLIFVFADAAMNGENMEGGSDDSLALSSAYLVAGLAIVVVSAEVTVSSAVSVADALDVEQSFVAIIIIGLGTSLPELSISLGAILHQRANLSIGNLIGSNVFDTLMPVGVAAAIAGLNFKVEMWRQELPFLFGLTLVVLFFFTRSRGIRRPEAAIVLGLYIAFATLKIQEVVL